MFYRWLAFLVVVLHFGYLTYLVTGGFVAWRWGRTIVLHVLAVAWAALTITARLPCPLTMVQNNLLALGGRPALGDTFINTYVRGVLYPAHHEVATRAVVATVIAVSWVGLVARSAATKGHGVLARPPERGQPGRTGRR
jgi:hypothetical protein